MTPQEMLVHCQHQVNIQGAQGRVVFWVSGRSPASGKKRLFGKRGPVGDVLTEESGRCLCMFEAVAVVEALVPLLKEVEP